MGEILEDIMSIGNITQTLMRRSNLLSIQQEVTDSLNLYSMFNTGGVEVEVGEFLYGLCRLIKPENVLETGTHLGISASYIAQALEDNGRGKITTLEIFHDAQQQSMRLWMELGLNHRVVSVLLPSLEHTANEQIDFLFLDSEPHLRFDEFVKFWPMVKPGGFIAIHDLHPNLGHSGQTVNGMFCWPFGDFREKLGAYIKNGEVSVFNFHSPRGFTLFQKTEIDFASWQHTKGLL